MDVRKLEAFCRVYELQSFSKAGDVMFLSQPTISSHVANLEEELGVKLFDRLGRTILPTDAGEVLYVSAVKVFANLDQARASIEMLRNRVVGDMGVGCSTIPSLGLLPQILSGFSRKYPAVNFTVHTHDSTEIIQRVLSGEFPVGIVGQKPEEPELVAVQLADDERVLVASPKVSWLPDRGPVSLSHVASLPWIMRERGSATRRVLEKALEEAGHSIHDLPVRCRVEGTSEGLAYAAQGMGVCFTSRLVAEDMIARNVLTALDVPALAGTRQFYLIYHSGRHMFPALKAFVGFNSSE
ncbi:LysR family transcriptional regulator [Pseudodesulfovibrio sp. JC047]|uniref:selenium metabolism-associated LysR family transcriptional regulator n=1 Tax=Pseudodesulfovibrio sp. JC047 TaxID=2683199 RepID=UPI0013D5939F|nr:selenium metabolism-associated LysR family transcriptional regulator [Pseudodesulfovibrio sp. JC047]NDV17923.1 LysR family transcriptional regulator [Pseudodesulfovibrio sp. JC047]